MNLKELDALYKKARGETLDVASPQWKSSRNYDELLTDSLKAGATALGMEFSTLVVGRFLLGSILPERHDEKGWETIWENGFLKRDPAYNIGLIPVIESLGIRFFSQDILNRIFQSLNLLLGYDLAQAYSLSKAQSRLVVALASGLAICNRFPSGALRILIGPFNIFPACW